MDSFTLNSFLLASFLLPPRGTSITQYRFHIQYWWVKTRLIQHDQFFNLSRPNTHIDHINFIRWKKLLTILTVPGEKSFQRRLGGRKLEGRSSRWWSPERINWPLKPLLSGCVDEDKFFDTHIDHINSIVWKKLLKELGGRSSGGRRWNWVLTVLKYDVP